MTYSAGRKLLCLDPERNRKKKKNRNMLTNKRKRATLHAKWIIASATCFSPTSLNSPLFWLGLAATTARAVQPRNTFPESCIESSASISSYNIIILYSRDDEAENKKQKTGIARYGQPDFSTGIESEKKKNKSSVKINFFWSIVHDVNSQPYRFGRAQCT